MTPENKPVVNLAGIRVCTVVKHSYGPLRKIRTGVERFHVIFIPIGS